MKYSIKTKEVQALMDVARRCALEPEVATVAAAYVALLATRQGDAFPLPELKTVLEREKGLPPSVRSFLTEQLAGHWGAYRLAAGPFDEDGLVEFFGNEAARMLADGRRAPAPHPAVEQLCVGLLEIGKGDTFADLNCGCGKFLRKAWMALWDAAGSDRGLSVTGYAWDEKCRALAWILCHVTGVGAHVLEQGIFQPCKERYDRILLIPPFGMELRALNASMAQAALEGSFGNFPPLKQAAADWVFAARAASLLAPGGRAVVAVPQNALNGAQSRAYREFLVRNRLVGTVVSLPRDFLAGTHTPFALVVLREGAGEIKFVDGARYLRRPPDGPASLDVAALLRDCRDLHDYEAVTTKAIEKIYAQECNLAPDFHLGGELAYADAHPLGSLVKEIRRGAKLPPEAWTPAPPGAAAPAWKVSLKHIGDGLVDGELPGLAGVPPGAEGAVAESGDLLVSRMGSPIKMAVVEPRPGKLVADENVWIVRTGGDRTTAWYLRAWLESPRGAKWLARLSTGVALQTISAKNLARIPVPDADAATRAAVAGKLEAATREVRADRDRLAASLAAMKNVYDDMDKNGGL